MLDWIINNFRQIEHWGWVIYIISISCWVLLEKRPPVSTVAWILSLSFLPVLGFFIFYFFGPRKIRRQRISRESSKRILGHEETLIAKDIWNTQIDERYHPIASLIFQLSNMYPSYTTHYELLSGGSATFDSIFHAIREAKEYVLLEYYIYDADQTGTALRDLLIQKAKEGVAVFLLVDRLGSLKLTRHFMHDLVEAGGQFEYFHNISFKHFMSAINFRNHRKIVVCDGLTAFMGGVNISDSQDKRKNPHAFHDVHIKLNGPIVHWFELIFAQDWLYSNHNKDNKLVSVLKDTTLTREKFAESLTPIEPAETPLPPQSLVNAKVCNPYYMQLIPSGPDTDHAPILQAMLTAMYWAKKRIYLTTPYFVPNDSALQALLTASERGVDVQIMVPHNPDNIFVRQASRSWYEDLILAGIKVYEYMPSMLHSKTLIIDDDIGFIGSANFDYRSFYLNFEISLICYDEKITQSLLQEYLKTQKHSRLVELKKYPFHTRLIQAIGRVFSPIL